MRESPAKDAKQILDSFVEAGRDKAHPYHSRNYAIRFSDLHELHKEAQRRGLRAEVTGEIGGESSSLTLLCLESDDDDEYDTMDISLSSYVWSVVGWIGIISGVVILFVDN
jgi:hypothetical protein